MAFPQDQREKAQAKRDLARRARRLGQMQSPDDRERLFKFAAELEGEAAAMEQELGAIEPPLSVVVEPQQQVQAQQQQQQQQSTEPGPSDDPKPPKT
jgi:hypothetical protein